MSDLAVTPANVSNATPRKNEFRGLAGATLTAGQVVLIDTDGLFQPAVANEDAATASAFGIVLEDAAQGQAAVAQYAGVVNIGATVTVGMPYLLSGANMGGIAPCIDLANGWRPVPLGTGTAAGQITLGIDLGGVNAVFGGVTPGPTVGSPIGLLLLLTHAN